MAKGKKTGGRTVGTPNKATQEVKEAAQIYAPDALKELHKIMTTSESDAAKVSAAREILDRACGKPQQAVKTEHTGSNIITDILESLDGSGAGLPSEDNQ